MISAAVNKRQWLDCHPFSCVGRSARLGGSVSPAWPAVCILTPDPTGDKAVRPSMEEEQNFNTRQICSIIKCLADVCSYFASISEIILARLENRNNINHDPYLEL